KGIKNERLLDTSREQQQHKRRHQRKDNSGTNNDNQPEGRHEMLNELNKDEVIADVLGWVKGKVEMSREK
ncbi:MAG: hypothetical protein LBU99_02710, partial [Spirochaetaceae bacterium]|nr:hypothetical protein [Spirochaetaceae bacterium]